MTAPIERRDRPDRIEVRGVRAVGRHGVLAHEKEYPQPFVVDADLEVDLSAAGEGDDLADSVSYAQVAARIVARLTGPSVDLIERLAQLIADDCLAFEAVAAVEVAVHKPAAPVGVDFGDVAVRIRRGQGRTAVVALGGNLPGPLGGPEHTLAWAVRDLDELPGTRVRALSGLVVSPAMRLPGDEQPQPDYLNAVAVLRTDLHPRTLLAHLHRIEADHGRVRTARWGPRTLDLDLVDVATAEGRSLRLDGAVRLPHPGAAERDFVVGPWAQVDPAGVARFLADAAGATQAGDGPAPGPAWPACAHRWVRTLGLLPDAETDYTGHPEAPAPVEGA